MLGECFRRAGRKTEMEKKDERIANLERLLGKRESELDWLSKKAIAELYEEDATLGRRRMPIMLQRRYSISISEKKCERIKKQLGLRTLYPHRNTSAPNPRAEKKPYLLKDMEIDRIDQV